MLCQGNNSSEWIVCMLKQPRIITQQGGFTLIEIVVGIVTLGIALALLTVLLFPQAKRSAEPLLQMRAAELGIALMNEITSKSFDENSDHSGGAVRCGETDPFPCSVVLGPDIGEARSDYNDVDDYHGLNDMTNSLGSDLSARYPGFSYAINVCYSTVTGLCDAAPPEPLYKRIEIAVTTPLGQRSEEYTS